jgi:hypothetical protein
MACWGDGERLARVDLEELEVAVERAALRVPRIALDS